MKIVGYIQPLYGLPVAFVYWYSKHKKKSYFYIHCCELTVPAVTWTLRDMVGTPMPLAILWSPDTDRKRNVLMRASSDEISSEDTLLHPLTSLGGDTLVRRTRRNSSAYSPILRIQITYI